MRYSVTVGASIDGRDRWQLCRGNTIVRAWSMPRWLSFRQAADEGGTQS